MHNPCFSFSYVDPEMPLRSIDTLEFPGYRKENIEIRLMQFTTGTDHKSANRAVVQLGPFGRYDSQFKTHIAIMGDYLVVILARYLDGRLVKFPPSKYQTRYLVNWVKGHVIHVRTVRLRLIIFRNFNVPCRNSTSLKIHISQS